MFEKIKRSFLNNLSINKTVDETGYNKYKVRRILLTMGLWESRRSREVTSMMEHGLSKEQIANKLHITIKGLESYMPYTRGAYFESDSLDTKYSKGYRERKENSLNKQIRKQQHKGENAYMNGLENLSNPKVFKIKLSLGIDEIDEKELDILRKYGKAKKWITRTILIPSSMQLNRLNYVIQKCFGFYNSHLHHFVLSKEDFARLTHNDLNRWRELAGKVFRCYFTDGENDDYYYLDDYDGSISFKTWLKRKYAKPYDYSPSCESMDVIQKEIDFVKKTDRYDDIRLSLLECGGEELLERLQVEDVFDIAKEFFYEYDYGDGWRIRIELLEEYDNGDKGTDPNINVELMEPVEKVMSTLSPICLEADGLPVIEDVGGVYGYCDFLKGLHAEENNHGYVKEDMEWAKSQGWNGRQSKAEILL